MISISSRPSEPSSPACGLRPATAILGRAMAKSLARAAATMRTVASMRLGGYGVRHACQRNVNRQRHDAQFVAGEHHDRRVISAGIAKFGEGREIFGMAGVAEAGLVEDRLGDGVGDDGAGAPGIGGVDGLFDRREHGCGVGCIRGAGLGVGAQANWHDGQRGWEALPGVLDPLDDGNGNLEADAACAVAEKFGTGERSEDAAGGERSAASRRTTLCPGRCRMDHPW